MTRRERTGPRSRLAFHAFRPRRRKILTTVLTLGVAAASALGAPPHAGPAPDAPAHHGDHSHMRMAMEEMRAQAEAWWSTHAPVGSSAEASAGLPAATFTLQGFTFDLDGNAGTPVDTAQIEAGQSVMWQWIDGFHTITSGTGSGPGSGSLFEQPSDSGHQQFVFVFNDPGTFPFFCRFHEFVNMRGVVVVSTPTGVGEPRAGEALGFSGALTPNPTAAGTSFRFTLRGAGHARAEVFDASGRRVAVVLDQDFAPGTYSAIWDGRAGDVLADTGVYYLRLELPGFVGSRLLVVRR